MLEVAPSNWSLLEGSSILRTSSSLSRLAKPPIATATDFKDLMTELSMIDPLGPQSEDPWVHLGICAERVTVMVSGFPDEIGERIGSIYETALIAGFDDADFTSGDGHSDLSGSEDLREVAAIGWKHGEQIRRWWTSYCSIVNALFGRHRG